MVEAGEAGAAAMQGCRHLQHRESIVPTLKVQYRRTVSTVMTCHGRRAHRYGAMFVLLIWGVQPALYND